MSCNISFEFVLQTTAEIVRPNLESQDSYDMSHIRDIDQERQEYPPFLSEFSKTTILRTPIQMITVVTLRWLCELNLMMLILILGTK